jgi:hypothetical protein
MKTNDRVLAGGVMDVDRTDERKTLSPDADVTSQMDETGRIAEDDWEGITQLAQDGLPEILPAYEDHVFKSHISSIKARDGLSELISDFVKRPVGELVIRQNELGISDIDAKAAVLDVNCAELADGSGDQFNVEMNAHHMEGDNLENEQYNLRCRAVYNMCDLHVGQKAKGVQYSKLVRTYQITFTRFATTAEPHDLVDWYNMRNKSGKLLCDHINTIFVDLSFAAEIARRPVTEMTDEEMWTLYFAKGHDPRYRETINEIRAIKKGVAVMYESLCSISSDPDERAKLLSLRRIIRDREHNYAVIRDEESAKWQKVVANKDAAIANKDAAIADKDAVIADKDAEIARLRAQLGR